MGFLIGQRFSQRIKNRVDADTILQNQLRPFAQTPQSESLLKVLFDNNQRKFPLYWDELLGTAAGSGVPLLDVISKVTSISFFSFSGSSSLTARIPVLSR
jgi:hypothetical protein